MRKKLALIVVVVISCSFVSVLSQGQQASAENGRKVVHKVEPAYPPVAKRMNLGGTVKVIAVVAPDGNVRKVEPVGGSPLLVEAAENAVSHWKYVPGGESRETIEMHFTP
jgi:TonB family protein